MQTKVKTVAKYLAEIPTARKSTVTRLRAECRRLLEGYEEGMEYGMPTYKRNGVVEVAFASQKNYISLYILKRGAIAKHKASLKGLKVGKSGIQFLKPDDIDFSVVGKLLTETARSAEAPCE